MFLAVLRRLPPGEKSTFRRSDHAAQRLHSMRLRPGAHRGSTLGECARSARGLATAEAATSQPEFSFRESPAHPVSTVGDDVTAGRRGSPRNGSGPPGVGSLSQRRRCYISGGCGLGEPGCALRARGTATSPALRALQPPLPNPFPEVRARSPSIQVQEVRAP